ncbi:transporter substrate-binding domain-containing protein [Algibacillus agarilyticus]|uniref:transporter substrate-binding domain-containing protein n=1 Tax=Algibacillus agarilyticus TaxID=2234133 RepID=UPI000DD03AF4|nr:transporter substrate-binding domain-containing protein [Algibacillus agarilyticus]
MLTVKSSSLFIICLVCTISLNAAELIRHNKIDSAKEAYQLGILKLALSYDQSDYEFEERDTYLTQTKLLNDLDTDNIDVAWVGTSKAYEDRFLPVRIPLFKGLLGHRIFLIRDGEQPRYNQIKTLDDLSHFKAGQGASWSDAKIMKDAGLSVVTTAKYQNLFYMLDGERFDYFPRSVYSPWAEMAKHPDLKFNVEENLMIVYPLPAYIFVNKNNIELSRRITEGLFQAIEDGSFDQYFYNHDMIKQGLEQSDIKQRKIFKLTNPELTDDTPLDDARLWFDVDKFET